MIPHPNCSSAQLLGGGLLADSLSWQSLLRLPQLQRATSPKGAPTSSDWGSRGIKSWPFGQAVRGGVYEGCRWTAPQCHFSLPFAPAVVVGPKGAL